MVDTLNAPLLETVAPNLLPELRAYLERHRAALARMLDNDGEGGVALGCRHAKIMDGLLTALYPAAFATMKDQKRWAPVLLAAVGGYGRGVVGLKSDLDVRLLTTQSPEHAAPIAEALLYPLWDVGVSIGHQVVSVSDALETAKTDLPTATALLDWRAIAGDVSAGQELEERAFGGIFSQGELPSFMARLDTEVAERHQRFGASVYLLEPDVKNGAGGLRDLDVALWAARARWRVKAITDLVRLGVLVTREANEITAASDFLWTVRNHLHHHAGRRSDRLTFEEQETIARAMGYQAKVGKLSDDAVDLSGAIVETFMSDYYRHARTIMRAREQIVARATPTVVRKRPHEEDLGRGLKIFDGQVTLAEPGELWNDPALALRIYSTAIARSVPLLPFARDAIARVARDPGFGTSLRESDEAAKLFVELVSTAQETRLRQGSVLADLHDVGLLVAMIPEFSPVVGRVHHDLYHVYTVDVHSVAAVDRLRALVRGVIATEYPLACRLAAEVTRPAILFLATLLHDVGKAIGGKDHSKRGAEMARGILGRLKLAADDIDEGCHLILQHLLMYHVATRRDLEDPATVEEFAREVKGREGLRDLYLLTVSDLSTTSPTSMTTWKARMLDDLFLAADRFLSGQTKEEGRGTRVAEQVRKEWKDPATLPFLSAFLESMPERYLFSNSPEEIAAHALLAKKAEGQPVTAGLVPSRYPEAAELCVIAADRPGLLAALTAAVAASRLEVHKAEIHSRTLSDGTVQAVDLFWVRHRADGAAGAAKAMPKLERDLRAVLTGKSTPRDLGTVRVSSPWAERPAPAVTTEIAIDDRASAHQTVIEVVTRDRPGLLFALADALHSLGLSIAVAKINTEGNRVADVFYVTETGGSKIEPGPRTQEVRARLLRVLEDLAKQGSRG
ncbi:MAG: [protein-PII] uridylyltransferase [Polyangiaceae bacterium]